MANKVDMHWEAADGGYELRNWGVQKLAADPGTNLFVGRIYFNTVSNKLRTYNGSAWIEYGTGAGTGDVTQAANSGSSGRLKVSSGADKSITDYATAGIIKSDASGVVSAAVAGTDYVTAASTNTLTNKTFDANGTGNSITNIETADLAAAAFTTSTTLAAASNTQIPSALAVKTYVDGIVVGLFDDRGNYDASVNTFPVAGGSGAAGAVLKGDVWRISVAGTLGGSAVQIGDTIRALVDTPAQTAANWAIMQANDQQATTSLVGNTRYATNAEALAKTVSDAAVTPAALAGFGVLKESTFGDNTAVSFTIAHGAGSDRVMAEVYEVATGEKRYPNIVIDSTNIVISGYITAPTAGQFKVKYITPAA